MRELAWNIGGEQGQGLDSTSDVFATVCNRMGYYIYAYKSFASRIKGGHTNFTVRVSTQPTLAPAPALNVLVCMDQEAIDKTVGNLMPNGLLMADAAFKPKAPAGVNLIEIPFTEIARELGNPIYRNMVAIGASAELLGLRLQPFKDYLQEKFGRKGEDVVKGNWAALERGHQLAQQEAHGREFHMADGDGKQRLIMTGNDAVALGAVAGGCRISVAYPITPASEILENMAKFLPKFGGAAIQVEDELAAIGACIGAGFGGARAMTATSGPGISLMQEFLGLASMAEIPVVVVDTQRSGPSTGMPTKHEQSDLLAMVLGGHGEGPRIVLAPGTCAQAFYDTAAAFNLADNFHCPVLIASDLGLSQWQQTVDEVRPEDVIIDRGPLISAEELEQLGRDVFRRYGPAANGVSPRSLPGQKYGQYLATGVEHSEFGKVTEDPKNRVKMMDRRLGKLGRVLEQVKGVITGGAQQPRTLIISYGSTMGAAQEAVELLREEGASAGWAQVRVIHPLPARELQALIDGAEQVFVVENNATAQLVQLMKLADVDTKKVQSILRYDGTLFRAADVLEEVQTRQGVRV